MHGVFQEAKGQAGGGMAALAEGWTRVEVDRDPLPSVMDFSVLSMGVRRSGRRGVGGDDADARGDDATLKIPGPLALQVGFGYPLPDEPRVPQGGGSPDGCLQLFDETFRARPLGKVGSNPGAGGDPFQSLAPLAPEGFHQEVRLPRRGDLDRDGKPGGARPLGRSSGSGFRHEKHPKDVSQVRHPFPRHLSQCRLKAALGPWTGTLESHEYLVASTLEIRMYRKILVPLDGSDFAESAIPLAVSLAQKTGGELHLVTVVAPLPAVRPGTSEEGPVKGWFEEERSRGTRYLKAVEARLRKENPEMTVHSRVLTGPVAPALEERIGKVDADLVVMTTHGRGQLERMWLGSVADALVRSGPCPILLWRSEEDEVEAPKGDINRILVPLDGSEESAAILPHVRSLAGRMDASVSLFSVFDHGPALGSTYVPHAAEEEAEREGELNALREQLEKVAGDLRSEGVEVDTRVEVNESPARAILEYRAEIDADLVAMTTRGRGGVTRLVVGSVADKVIRAGLVPVLVTRQSD